MTHVRQGKNSNAAVKILVHSPCILSKDQGILQTQDQRLSGMRRAR